MLFIVCTDVKVHAQGADWKALNDEAEQLYHSANYTRGVDAAKLALALAEKTHGPDHPDVASSLDILGWLYRAEGHERRRLGEQFAKPLAVYPARRMQGHNAQAEALFKRALAIREKALGADNPDVATSLNSLATLYSDHGQYTNDRGYYSKAKPLFKRALAIREKCLPPDHPDLAGSLNNLANVYLAEGDNADAAPLYARALAISEKALGPDHPNVAINLHNLALALRDQGKYAEAEPLFGRSIEIYEKAFGADHPDVGRGLESMAELYRRTSRNQEARKLDARAATIRGTIRGTIR